MRLYAVIAVVDAGGEKKVAYRLDTVDDITLGELGLANLYVDELKKELLALSNEIEPEFEYYVEDEGDDKEVRE